MRDRDSALGRCRLRGTGDVDDERHYLTRCATGASDSCARSTSDLASAPEGPSWVLRRQIVSPLRRRLPIVTIAGGA